MKNDRLGNKICDRCFTETRVSIMSKFNKDILCMACKTDERALPSYAAASEREIAAVRSGDYNFPGVGLTAADHEFLSFKRINRDKVSA